MFDVWCLMFLCSWILYSLFVFEYSCTHVLTYSCIHVLMYSCILARLSLKGTKVQKRKKGRKTCGKSFKNDNLRLIWRRSAINERVIVLKVYFKCAAFRLFIIDLYVRKKWWSFFHQTCSGQTISFQTKGFRHYLLKC